MKRPGSFVKAQRSAARPCATIHWRNPDASRAGGGQCGRYLGATIAELPTCRTSPPRPPPILTQIRPKPPPPNRRPFTACLGHPHRYVNDRHHLPNIDYNRDTDSNRVTADEVDIPLRSGKTGPVSAKTRISGVRPLVASDARDPSGRNVSRGIVLFDHAERDGLDGFITITGGKTTYRLMAEWATDAVKAAKLGNTRPASRRDYRRSLKESTEHTLKRIICFLRYAAIWRFIARRSHAGVAERRPPTP